MGVLDWVQRRADAMTIWDIGFLKVYVALMGMIIGAYFATFVRENVGWFVAVVVILGGRGAFRWLTAVPRDATPHGV